LRKAANRTEEGRAMNRLVELVEKIDWLVFFYLGEHGAHKKTLHPINNNQLCGLDVFCG